MCYAVMGATNDAFSVPSVLLRFLAAALEVVAMNVFSRSRPREVYFCVPDKSPLPQALVLTGLFGERMVVTLCASAFLEVFRLFPRAYYFVSKIRAF